LNLGAAFFVYLNMRKVFSFVLLLIVNFCSGQNLVPNPSFESINGCPVFQDELYRAVPWFKPTANSSDLFHACYVGPQNTSVGVPSNFWGYQNARTGLAYAGFACRSGNPNAREYISVMLSDSLNQGAKYCLEFYVSLADSSLYGISSLAGYFSENQILDLSKLDTLNLPAQVIFQQPVSDTVNWYRVSGSFVANGGERFLTIGVFASDDVLIYDTVNGSNNFIGTYYYIDDVSITECPEPPPLISSLVVSNVFTPNQDGINDAFTVQSEYLQTYSMQIYDRWGVLVFETFYEGHAWDGRSTSGIPCNEGTYFYIIRAIGVDEKEYQYKGSLMLAR
jgi:gliding motility-associated-like protein